MKRLAVIGEYSPEFDPHLDTNSAIAHVLAPTNTPLAVDWISTSDLSLDLLTEYDGLWIAPGSPYDNLANAVNAIRWVRENDIPCLGTCGGFQHMMIEYARNFLDIEQAQHAEYDPYSSELFISELDCSLKGREMTLNFEDNSQVAEIYGATQANEKYYCNFGVNPEYVDQIKDGILNVSGSDTEGDIRVVEHPDHPFYIGTLFVPQSQSSPEAPHPLVESFLGSIIKVA